MNDSEDFLEDNRQIVRDWMYRHEELEWRDLLVSANREVRKAVEYLILYDRITDLVEITHHPLSVIRKWRKDFEFLWSQEIGDDYVELRQHRVHYLTTLLTEYENLRISLLKEYNKEDQPIKNKLQINRDMAMLMDKQRQTISEIGNFEGSKAPTKLQSQSTQLNLNAQIEERDYKGTIVEEELRRIIKEDESDSRRAFAADLLGRVYGNDDKLLEEGSNGPSSNLLLEG